MTAGPGTTDLRSPNADPYRVADAAAARIADFTGAHRHDIAVVLGSGWAGVLDMLGETRAEAAQSALPGFGPSIPGQLPVVRSVAIPGTQRRALCFGGRTHLYEGDRVRQVVHPVRTAAAAGCQVIVLTNGAGSVRDEWPPGTPVLIRDHINLTGTSPLEGATFVDLTAVYAQRLRDVAHQVDGTLPHGVYVQFRGPHYETPAEAQMAARLGGDLVGMSTALEAIAARAAGLEVLGISLVTNYAAGIGPGVLSHADVVATGTGAAARLGRLLASVLANI